MNDRDISLNSMFCPLCRASHFNPHIMQEYSLDWNKCASCGYMELIEITKNRILSTLAPDQLTKPFIEPITAEIRNKVGNMKIQSQKIKSKNNCNQGCNCTCTNKTN